MILKVSAAVIVSYALIILLGSMDTDTKDADYLIVLGHALISDLLPLTLIMRLDAAVRYLKANPNCKVILSGGKTKTSSIPEAVAMEEYLIQKNIAKDRIIREMYASDTIENIKYSKEMLKEEAKVLVLSSRYHILRVKMICKMLKLKAEFMAANASPQDSIVHLFMEEYLIIQNYIRLRKEEVI